MTLSEYQRLAIRTAGGDADSMAIYGPMGLAGETGEVVDYLKKVHFHGHDLDDDKLAEELGDVLWYAAAICSAYGLNMNEVARANIAKLQDRYPHGFESSRSRERS